MNCRSYFGNGFFQNHFLKLALPDNDNIPSFGFQLTPDLLVTFLISGDLGRPESNVGLGHRIKLAPIVTVPKASVDKDNCMVLGKDNIRGAR